MKRLKHTFFVGWLIKLFCKRVLNISKCRHRYSCGIKRFVGLVKLLIYEILDMLRVFYDDYQ